jgi:glycosyltransferase involved in cell wall biosynthesis
MIEGLRRNDVDVVECHEPLWCGIEDRVKAASGGWLRPSFIVRIIQTYYRLLKTYQSISDYDVMIVGYPGQVDVYLARILTWLRHRPLVLDVFMSIYLIASERGLTSQHPVTARVIFWLEKIACLLPDQLIIDTVDYVEWFQKNYGLKPQRFQLVPTGADDSVFQPLDKRKDEQKRGFKVVYYGTFIPNHGVQYIIEAANILKDESDIYFELIGEGPTKAKALELARDYELDNVTFLGWVDKQCLPCKVTEADVCLGAFGQTPQSLMTVQNKIYEGMAMEKPVITGYSPAVASLVDKGVPILMSDRSAPQSLATSILNLKNNPSRCRSVARNLHRIYTQHFTVSQLGSSFRQHLESLVDGKGIE